MVKTVICSVGTSAAKALKMRPSDLSNWVIQQKNIDDAAEQIVASFLSISPEGESLKTDLSAEIHSLVRIGIDNQDRIVFLASGTDDGYCCALAVKKYLEHHWRGIEVTTYKIEGLQVLDADLFRTTGVVNFVQHIIREVDHYGAENIILNPTGGFKALVPYTVLLGMLKGIKCDYIFEQSTTLLELPPLPVEFRRSQFEAYRELFEQIERETSISQTTWDAKVPYAENIWFKPLIESLNGQITLSGVGFLFLQEMRSPSILVPFLSKKAVDDCFNNLIQLDDCDPFRFLSRVAASRDAFNQAEHINTGNGLRWLKPGRTTDRYLVSIEGWRMLVWRAIREDQEGRDYPTKIIVNHSTERSRYSPFMRMEFVN